MEQAHDDALSVALDSLSVLESVDIAEILSKLSAEPHFVEKFLSSALHTATGRGLTDVVEKLIKHGADRVLEELDAYGNTPLIMAAVRDHTDIIYLLLEAGCFVNRSDSESRTALHWVSMNGNVQAAKDLLQHGAWPDHPDNLYSFTPIMLATRHGHTDIVRLLLQYDCVIDRRDRYGETPLFDAVRNNNLECMKLLISSGADVDAKDKQGRSPIFNSILYHRPSAMRYLIAQNCNLYFQGNLSIGTNFKSRARLIHYSPLEVAVMEAREEQCKMLVAAGADTKCLNQFLQMRTDSTFENGNSVKEWLREVLSQPPKTLKHLARLSIRRFYETNLPVIVDNLPLPNALKDYVLLRDVTVCDEEECNNYPDDYQGYIPIHKSTPV